MIKAMLAFLIRRAEKKVGVSFDYTHHIAQTSPGLLIRYNRIFGFLDPNKNTPALAHHTARLRGAIAADCGTCVEAEINLARIAGLDDDIVSNIIAGDYQALPEGVAAVAHLCDAVVGRREDDPEAREIIRAAFGEAGLIELTFAMNGAALLPGIKRAMGFATACDIDLLRKMTTNRP